MLSCLRFIDTVVWNKAASVYLTKEEKILTARCMFSGKQKDPLWMSTLVLFQHTSITIIHIYMSVHFAVPKWILSSYIGNVHVLTKWWLRGLKFCYGCGNILAFWHVYRKENVNKDDRYFALKTTQYSVNYNNNTIIVLSYICLSLL